MSAQSPQCHPRAQCVCRSWEHGFSPPSCWNWYFGGPSSNPLDGCGVFCGMVVFISQFCLAQRGLQTQ